MSGMHAYRNDAAGAGAPSRFVALDPGKNIGYAMVDAQGRLLERAIVLLEELDVAALRPYLVVLGGGTGSERLARRLREGGVAPVTVDEAGSTLEARALYYRDHPPRGWRRLVPPGMRLPPRPVDDYAAYAIALRYLRSLRE